MPIFALADGGHIAPLGDPAFMASDASQDEPAAMASDEQQDEQAAMASDVLFEEPAAMVSDASFEGAAAMASDAQQDEQAAMASDASLEEPAAMASDASLEEPAAMVSGAPSAEQLAPITDLAQQDGAGFEAWAMLDRLMHGQALSFDEIKDAVIEYLAGALTGGGALLAMLLVPVILLSIVRQMIGEDQKKSAAAGYVCYLTTALALMQAFHQSAGSAMQLIERVGRWITELFPILSALMIACGAPATAAAYSPLMGLGAGLISGLISNLALAMCSIAAAVAISGSLTDRFSLSKLLGLLKFALYWMVGLGLTGFLGLVSFQNLLSQSQDSATMKAAKYAVGGLIPGVGGEIADTMNAVSGSAMLIKNATGITGLVALVMACLRPLLQLVVALLALKLCGALTEPLGSTPLQKLIERFSDVFSMLLVAAVAAVAVGITLVGAVLASGNAAILS
ncbi:stage III sporulation protein AE [Eubacteriales bacterium OttesenSCG-928-N13]|nr:stage III sporulation protein AE [Eubacteriales bacterium OttesenSCG-928-N13]